MDEAEKRGALIKLLEEALFLAEMEDGKIGISASGRSTKQELNSSD